MFTPLLLTDNDESQIDVHSLLPRMAYVKLAQLGPEGHLLINYMYTYMWQDAEKRLRKMDVRTSRRVHISSLCLTS